MRIGILGFGEMGRTVFRHLKKRNDVNVTVYDTNPSARQKAKADGVVCTDNLRDILGDPGIPLVFITAANAAHKDLALASIYAGKAVMLEKPITTNFEDSTFVVSESERLQTFLQIGFELRYSRLYVQVKRWIESGFIGDVVNVTGNYICSEFHGKNSWRNSLVTGGSMFGEKLSHYVDLPRWWIGHNVESVYAVSAPNVVPYYEVRDNYHTVCRFSNGSVSHLSFVMYAASSFDGDPLQNSVTQQRDDGHELRFLVIGTKGVAETDVFRRRIRRWQITNSSDGLKNTLAETLTWDEADDHVYFHNTEGQTLDVVERVETRRSPMTAARDSLESMRLCAAAEASQQSGQVVRVGSEEM